MRRQRTYRATGINLKAIPLGEADRIVTILTPERGLVRAVAAGARKQKSQLGGRTELFVVNELVLAEGDRWIGFPRRIWCKTSAAALQPDPAGGGPILVRSCALSSSLPTAPAGAISAAGGTFEPPGTIPHPPRSSALVGPRSLPSVGDRRCCSPSAPLLRLPGTSEWSFSPDAGGVACHHCIGQTETPAAIPPERPLRTVLKLLPRPQLPASLVPDPAAWLAMSTCYAKACNIISTETFARLCWWILVCQSLPCSRNTYAGS